MTGNSNISYIRLPVDASARNAVPRPQGAGQIGNRATLMHLGLSRERNIASAARDIRYYLDSFAELLYLKVIGTAVPAVDGTPISLGYRDFCKPSFYLYEKWNRVPVGVQIRMCEYLELQFPLLSLAEGQWASVVFWSGYFRRSHCLVNNGNHPSAGYQVPIVDDLEDEDVEDERLPEEQSEPTNAKLSDVSQREDDGVENPQPFMRVSATNCRQCYRAPTPTRKVTESRNLKAAKRDKQLANLERGRRVKLRQSLLAKRNLV
ncbi:hypothetical protein V1517DRAFT_327421 [Lipomyces orientalis]|uniref:Uncharacterized protein n=1 Tax=Lipomyces orientalis TaxID=1233043 RepID=A0ACC3TJT6_9ASCO